MFTHTLFYSFMIPVFVSCLQKNIKFHLMPLPSVVFLVFPGSMSCKTQIRWEMELTSFIFLSAIFIYIHILFLEFLLFLRVKVMRFHTVSRKVGCRCWKRRNNFNWIIRTANTVAESSFEFHHWSLFAHRYPASDQINLEFFIIPL